MIFSEMQFISLSKCRCYIIGSILTNLYIFSWPSLQSDDFDGTVHHIFRWLPPHRYSSFLFPSEVTYRHPWIFSRHGHCIETELPPPLDYIYHMRQFLNNHEILLKIPLDIFPPRYPGISRERWVYPTYSNRYTLRHDIVVAGFPSSLNTCVTVSSQWITGSTKRSFFINS